MEYTEYIIFFNGFNQVESHIWQEPNAIKRCIALAAKRLSQEAPDKLCGLGLAVGLKVFLG